MRPTKTQNLLYDTYFLIIERRLDKSYGSNS